MSEVVNKLAKTLAELSVAYGQILPGRQLLGAAWSPGNFWMGSRPSVEDGFWTVTYLVFEKGSGAVIGFGGAKGQALENARWAISCAGATGALIEKVAAELAAIRAQHDVEFDALMAAARGEAYGKKPPGKRGKVFEKSNGACHYCAAPLDINEDWHIEHMVPRSRGGADHISNLVAACRSCNYKKGTKTAEEFMASVAQA